MRAVQVASRLSEEVDDVRTPVDLCSYCFVILWSPSGLAVWFFVVYFFVFQDEVPQAWQGYVFAPRDWSF